MAYTITQLCADCKDIACTQVCPVDCIYEYTGDDPSIPKNMLLIDPDECIDCNACVPECPWQAIFANEEVPEVFAADIELNEKIIGQPRFVPERPEDQKNPTPEEIEANKTSKGYA